MTKHICEGQRSQFPPSPRSVGSEPLPTGPSHSSQLYHFNTCIRLETACEWGLSRPPTTEAVPYI